MAQAAASIDPCECPVCTDVFQTPKLLKCAHSICAKCVEELLKNRRQLPPGFGQRSIIECPLCRVETEIPSEGLLTNFALQDIVQHCQKRYKCVECGHSCTADEAWLSNIELKGDIALRCSRCIIKRSTNADSPVPTTIETVTDTFKRNEKNLTDLQQRMRSFAFLRVNWADDMDQTEAMMIIRDWVDEIIRGSTRFADVTNEGQGNLESEFQQLFIQTRSSNMPTSLEDLKEFIRSMEEKTSKMNRFEGTRKKLMADVALVQNVLENAATIIRQVVDGRVQPVENGIDELNEIEWFPPDVVLPVTGENEQNQNAQGQASGGGNSMEASGGGFGNSSGFNKGYCIFCKKEGHVIRECPKEGARRACYDCGNIGHLQRDCPTRVNANGTGGHGRFDWRVAGIGRGRPVMEASGDNGSNWNWTSPDYSSEW